VSRILVVGVVNLETTLRVDRFPIEYTPVRYPSFGVASAPSGVGYNLAVAMTTLGDSVRLLSFVGADLPGHLVRVSLAERGVDATWVLPDLAETAQSAILYDSNGRRQVNTDLKDLQERVYPAASFEGASEGYAIAVLTNVNFARPLLGRAREAGLRVASDVHAISTLDDPYNADFMQHTDILFMSHEALPVAPAAWVEALQQRYPADVVVVGMGAQGALLALRGRPSVFVGAARTRPVVSTVGAGDALFAGFLHFFAAGLDAEQALRNAVVFASYKIGERGGSAGFLDEAALGCLRLELAADGQF
jgi:sugar/nucleoside kinase (ribokinase family)